MKVKKTVSITIAILGIVLFLTSFYIKGRVTEGREQIREAQEKVDTGSKLFSITPETKAIGKGLTDAAQRKIDAGKKDAEYYHNLSIWFQVGGVIFILLGAGGFFLSRRK